MVIIKKILGSNMSLVGGIVQRYADGIGLAVGKVVNIRLDDGTDIAFWNSDDGTRKLATRIKNANVKVGSFLSALVSFKDEECKKANAINFKYNGIWTFKEKLPTASKSGIIMDMSDNGNEVAITLDDGSNFSFKNPQGKGYRFADRVRARAKIGYDIDIAVQNDAITNFKIGDNWEITRSISAIIGNVAFLDKGTTHRNTPYIRANMSIYNGRDKNGESNYETAYVYFDNSQNAEMISSVETKIPPKTPAVIVCSKNKPDDETDNVYTGYYFMPIRK